MIVVALITYWDNDGDTDECFFFHAETEISNIPEGFDYRDLINFRNDKIVWDKLQKDTLYSDSEFHKIWKATLSVEEFNEANPYVY